MKTPADNPYPPSPADAPNAIKVEQSWTTTATILVVLMQDGDADGRAIAAAEIRRMGRILDHLIADRDRAAQAPTSSGPAHDMGRM